jgi:hypothetical protein
MTAISYIQSISVPRNKVGASSPIRHLVSLRLQSAESDPPLADLLRPSIRDLELDVEKKDQGPR